MKQFIGVFLAVMTLCGCEQVLDTIKGKDVYDHIKEPPMTFASLNEAGRWIADNVNYYVSDPYEWHSPYQTMTTLQGHCVDYSILLLWYAVQDFGANYYNSYVLGVQEYSGSSHALCVINGVIYEPQTFKVRTRGYAAVIGKWNLDEALEKVYYRYVNRTVESHKEPIPVLD